MECIDLRTGFMMLSFRSLKEVERAKNLCETKGIDVACALAFDEIKEEEAANYVKHVSHNGNDMYCNYSNQSIDCLCNTAKESLHSALQYVDAMNGYEGGFLLIYQKQEPFLRTMVTAEAHA